MGDFPIDFSKKIYEIYQMYIFMKLCIKANILVSLSTKRMVFLVKVWNRGLQITAKDYLVIIEGSLKDQ